VAVAAVVVVDLDDVRGVLPVVCCEEGTAGAAESSRASSSSPSSDVLPPGCESQSMSSSPSDVLPPGCESQSMSSSPSDVLPPGGESQSMSSSPSDVLPLRGESQSMSSPSFSAASSPSTPSSVGAKPVATGGASRSAAVGGGEDVVPSAGLETFCRDVVTLSVARFCASFVAIRCSSLDGTAVVPAAMGASAVSPCSSAEASESEPGELFSPVNERRFRRLL